MAHWEKYTKAATPHELNHDRRAFKPKEDDGHIDHTMTVHNYNLGPQHDPWQFVKDKIAMSKNSGGRVNARTVACVSCIVTLPKDFTGDMHLFFETAKKYLDSVCGAHNCISAWVHFDEPDSMPHLHYKATPIMVEQKQDKNGHPITVHQFNAKKMISMSFLKKFHKQLDKAMTAVFGRPVGIINGICSEGALTVPQLKKQRQKTEQARKEYDTLIDDYNALVDDYNDLIEQVDTLKQTVSRLESKLKQYSHIADDILDDTPRKANGHDDREW